MLQTPLESQKEILGYRLIERIGSGGFGEVWSAVAPGGLKKALKVVYGYHDGRHAKAELKALDRVKELRHPFLLSLERIEVFDGQLVVVSELADCSLADLFNNYAAQGEPGIPRDEMLRYLRCSAEALDYLSDEHNLQHLDVKPENLLLVGSHVKVADFGLIKDLQKASQSLMSGMTPAYAAPELFDGCPVSNSDQYSLAIVYQEMITGSRPFPGNTPAQLAAQHMHGKPNLSKLSRQDQPIIAKALSKDPQLRFKNCRELVDELGNQRRAVKKALRRELPTRPGSDTESKTIQLDQKSGPDVTALITDRALPFQANEIKVLDPPSDCDGQAAKLRPTLIIGVGSTGGKVIQKMKGQLVARHRSMDDIPAIKLLAIDTDRNALGSLRRENGHGSLSNQESLETPLRKPEDYRGRANSHLSWLSRRWIYNVPRSLQTEGLRPLGRLAYADHFDAICDRIQDLIREMVTPEALAQTADTLNLDPGELAPRVFIVTSVSGGVGSGMVLDLAYATKLLLNECGLPAESVAGVLLHSTYQRYRDPGLSAANSFAFLTEMRHFVEQGFPGDATIGMPDFGEQPPFDHTYFNDLGSDLCQSEFESKLDRVAEYVLLSSTSRCAQFFDECRQLEEEIEHLTLRTFGLSMTGPGNLTFGKNAVQRVGKGLLRKWLSPEGATPISAEHALASILESNGLQIDPLKESLGKKLEAIPELDVVQLREQMFDLLQTQSDAPLKTVQGIADRAFGPPMVRRESGHVDSDHCLAIQAAVGVEAQAVGDALTNAICDSMSGSSMNLGYAQRLSEQIVDAVTSISTFVEKEAAELPIVEDQLLGLLPSIQISKASNNQRIKTDLNQILESYLQQRQIEYTLRSARQFCRIVLQSLDPISVTLKRFVNQIEMVAKEFTFVDELVPDHDDPCQLDMDQLLNEIVDRDADQHIESTEGLVYEHLIKERGGFIQSLSEASVWQSQLGSEIRSQAQRVLANAYKKSSLEDVVTHYNIEPERLIKWLNDRIMEAKPEIDDCGGATRLLVGMPELSSDGILRQNLEKQFHVNGCTIRGTQGNFVLCFEGEDISLANVAYRLLRARPDAIELVKRIQTRSDIDWITLDDLL